MTIYFDMDGTIANFYGVENWLKSIWNLKTMRQFVLSWLLMVIRFPTKKVIRSQVLRNFMRMKVTIVSMQAQSAMKKAL